MGRRKSKIWSFYNRLDNYTAKCKLCEKAIKTCGNTTNLRKHIIQRHKNYEQSELIDGQEPQIQPKLELFTEQPLIDNGDIEEIENNLTEEQQLEDEIEAPAKTKNIIVESFQKATSFTVTRSPHSKFWTFFDRHENAAICKLCGKTVKSSGSTSNLAKHIKRIHNHNNRLALEKGGAFVPSMLDNKSSLLNDSVAVLPNQIVNTNNNNCDGDRPNGHRTENEESDDNEEMRNCNERNYKRRSLMERDPLSSKLCNQTDANTNKDECGIFGEFVAEKLRSYDKRRRSTVQHIINNTIYEMDMDQLNGLESSGHYSASRLVEEYVVDEETLNPNS